MQRFTRRQKQSPPGRGRASTRWTPLEVMLVVMSVVMIAFPLYASALNIVNPPIAPAQEQATQAPADATSPPENTAAPEKPTSPPEATSPPAPTAAEAPPTSAPEQPTAAEAPPTSAPEQPTAAEAPTSAEAPTAAQEQPTAVPAEPTQEPVQPAQRVTDTPIAYTPTGGTAATDTPVVGQPTSTPVPPTDTTAPGQPTNTPVAVQPSNTAGTAEPTFTPFVPTEGAPIELGKFVSTSDVAPGQQFSYSLSVRTTSDTAITVSIRDSIDSRLDVLSASGDSCSVAQTVTCSVSVSKDSPAAITIQVRAHADASGTVSNQASASSNGTTAASDTVRVTISGSTVPTSGTSVPTDTPNPNVTVTNTSEPNPATSTSGPIQPSATSNPNQTSTNTAVPTATEKSSGGGGGGGGGGSSNNDDRKDRHDKATETPPPPPPPPVDQPAGPALPPAPTRVVAVATRRPVVAPRTATPRRNVTANTPVVVAQTPPTATMAQQASPTSSGPPVGDTNVFFRIASDWGSATTGQEVKYTIALQNTRSGAGSGDLNGLLLRSTLPSNLEVIGASSDRGGDPQVTGNDIQLQLASLRPGETVEISVRTRIKPNVARGTLIVSQAQASYTGLSQPLFSNVVTVLVVDAAPTTVAQAVTDTSSPATSTAQIVVIGSATSVAATDTAVALTPTSTLGGQLNQAATATSAVVSATPQRIVPTATVAPASPSAPLPNTSTGVPLMGFALLGLTMLVRTVRLKRARERI